jgi:hypothetical protein
MSQTKIKLAEQMFMRERNGKFRGVKNTKITEIKRVVIDIVYNKPIIE